MHIVVYLMIFPFHNFFPFLKWPIRVYHSLKLSKGNPSEIGFHLLVPESQKKIEKISNDYKNGKRGYFPKVPFQCEQSKWWEHNSRIGTNVSDRSIGYPKIDGPTKEEILFEKGYVSRRLYKLTNFPMK